jgi:hypothetical protein
VNARQLREALLADAEIEAPTLFLTLSRAPRRHEERTRALKSVWAELRRAGVRWTWLAEMGRDGRVPHYHVIVKGDLSPRAAEEAARAIQAAWRGAGGERARLEPIRSAQEAISYLGAPSKEAANVQSPETWRGDRTGSSRSYWAVDRIAWKAALAQSAAARESINFRALGISKSDVFRWAAQERLELADQHRRPPLACGS